MDEKWMMMNEHNLWWMTKKINQIYLNWILKWIMMDENYFTMNDK